MLKLVFLTVILLAVCFALMAVKVIFVKGGRFPSGHIGSNPHLRRRGISCASADARDQRHK